MNSRILLFVYGLLMADETGFGALDLERRVRRFGPDRVSGRLYHLGDYPGLVIGEHGLVYGEVYGFDDERLLEDIDAYELYDPENPEKSEYLRIDVELLASRQSAWTYVYNRPVTNRPIIATGNWRVR